MPVCTPAGSDANASATLPITPATAVMAGASAVPKAMAADSTAPPMFSSAQDSSPFWALAMVSAAVASLVAAMYLASPSLPDCIRMAAAREASEPKMVWSAASRSASLRLPSLPVSSSAMPDMSFILPLESRMFRP